MIEALVRGMLCLIVALGGAACHTPPAHTLVYVGTYAEPQNSGIYCYDLDLTSGEMTAVNQTSGVANPSYLAVHPSKPLLYAVSEVGKIGDAPGGGVVAFEMDAGSGQLELRSMQSSGGAGPCHVSVDAGGRYVMAANYGSGHIACLPIDEGGRLQPAESVVRLSDEGQPRAHAVAPDPTGRFALATDLGCNRVNVFALVDGKFITHEPSGVTLEPKTGPRHFVFAPSGKHLYVINEQAGTIDAFSWNAQVGSLTPVDHISTLPADDAHRRWAAHVAVHPSGRWLYASNRGADNIALFQIDVDSGKLTSMGYEPARGRTPRHFGIDPTGRFMLVAAQDSNHVQVFRIDPQTGRLAAVGEPAAVPKPACVVFYPRD